ncbi:MAG: tetratricopeptide repeat protein [Cyclobacteriaceae bacterium]
MSKDWYNTSLEHLDQENYSQAILSIDCYIEQHPKNKNGRLLRAVIYGHLSNYNKVLEILADISPSDDDSTKYSKLYCTELGDTYKELGNFSEALNWYDQAIEIAPNETVGYIMKGCCLASMGDYEGAKTEHLKATKLEGDPEEAFYNLALIARAELKLEDAIEYCEKSLEIDPDDIKVIHCRKDILDAIRMKKEVNKHYHS